MRGSLGRVKTCSAGPDLDQLARLVGAHHHYTDTIRNACSLLHIVSDDYDGDALLQLVDQVLYLEGRDRVEGRRRFIHEQHFGLNSQGAGDAEPLLLATAE